MTDPVALPATLTPATPFAARPRTAEQLRGDPRTPDALSAFVFGKLAHRAIQQLALAWPDSSVIDHVVATLMRQHGTRNPSLRRRLTSSVATYARFTGPRPDSRVLATEEPCGRARADIVWCSRDTVWIDELKLGDVTRPNAQTTAQIDALLDAGYRRWGNTFSGVRLISLQRPSATTLYCIDGR